MKFSLPSLPGGHLLCRLLSRIAYGVRGPCGSYQRGEKSRSVSRVVAGWSPAGRYQTSDWPCSQWVSQDSRPGGCGLATVHVHRVVQLNPDSWAVENRVHQGLVKACDRLR